MKANELMLGDWIYGIDGAGGKHPARINAVDIYPLNRTPRVVTSGGYGYQQEHLEPIPLTIEILEKNFEKKVFFGIFDDYFDLTIYEYSDSLYIADYHCCEMTLPDQRVTVCFVHELQHFLTHCGIKKEIEI